MEQFEYITMQGDTFDILAMDAYNDEFKAHIIMEANPDHIGTVIFPAGVKLIIPIITEQPAETLPPWKR